MQLNQNLSGIKLPRPDDFTRENLTFLVLLENEQSKDIYDLPLTYSLETGVVRWEDAEGIRAISLRDNEELSKLWEPMTAERFTCLMATLHPTFTREAHKYERCLLNISPEGQILKSDSDEDLEFTSLAYFPRPVGRDEKEGWEYWDTLLAPDNHTRHLIAPAMDREMVKTVASQSTLADFGWEAESIHSSIQEEHPITAEMISEIYGVKVARGLAAPNDPEAVQQTAAYLREKLAVDPHPAMWTPEHWASANNARLNSRLHAQTAKFPPDQACQRHTRPHHRSEKPTQPPRHHKDRSHHQPSKPTPNKAPTGLAAPRTFIKRSFPFNCRSCIVASVDST